MTRISVRRQSVNSKPKRRTPGVRPGGTSLRPQHKAESQKLEKAIRAGLTRLTAAVHKENAAWKKAVGTRALSKRREVAEAASRTRQTLCGEVASLLVELRFIDNFYANQYEVLQQRYERAIEKIR